MLQSITMSIRLAAKTFKTAADLTMDEAEQLFEDLRKFTEDTNHFTRQGLLLTQKGQRNLKQITHGLIVTADNFADTVKKAVRLLALAAAGNPAFEYLKGYLDKRVLPQLQFLDPHQHMKPYETSLSQIEKLIDSVSNALQSRGPSMGPRPPEMSGKAIKDQLERTKDIGENTLTPAQIRDIEDSRPTKKLPIAR